MLEQAQALVEVAACAFDRLDDASAYDHLAEAAASGRRASYTYVDLWACHTFAASSSAFEPLEVLLE